MKPRSNICSLPIVSLCAKLVQIRDYWQDMVRDAYTLAKETGGKKPHVL